MSTENKAPCCMVDVRTAGSWTHPVDSRSRTFLLESKAAADMSIGAWTPFDTRTAVLKITRCQVSSQWRHVELAHRGHGIEP